MRSRTLLFILVCVVGTAGTALAQPSAWVPPPPPEPAVASPAAPSKFSLGVQFVGGI